MTQNTPDTTNYAAAGSGYEHYHIGISGQMEHMYRADVENNPSFAIECIQAHVAQIARHYANKNHISQEELGTVRILALAGMDPTVRAELRHCEGMIAKARENLATIMGIAPEEKTLGMPVLWEQEYSE